MSWFRTLSGVGSGGGDATKRTAKLVLEAYATTYQDSTFPRTQWDSNSYDSSYFTYSSNVWTAQKDFTALVLLIHYQYQDASSSNSFSQATVHRELISGYNNFDVVSLCPTTTDRYTDSYGIEYVYVKIKAGDVIKEGKPVGLGYEAPYFYIFETEDDMPTTNLTDGDNVSFTTSTQGYTILQDYFRID